MSKANSSGAAGSGLNNSSTPAAGHASRFAPHVSCIIHHASFIAVLLLAAVLRFYQLPVLPPGLNFDEAGNGVAALDILDGAPRLWWAIGGGKEPFWPYLVALSTLALGNVPLALRLPAVMIGILSVAAVYPLLRALFRGRQGQLIALLTMLGLALSAWHLHFSRLGFRAILLPLLSTLSFYFLWRALTGTTSRLNLAISALFMALAIYAYLAARLLPVVILLYVTSIWFASLSFPRFTFHSSVVARHLSLIFRYFLYLLLFLIPLIFHFSRYPAEFLARSTTVSIFNAAWNKGDLFGTVWETLFLTLGTFLGLRGDANPLVNLPNQPAIPLFLAPFFLLGLFASLYRVLRFTKNSKNPLASPHLFLLCWWMVMLLPAILAPEGAPHHLRLIGTIVPTYAFIALGFVTIIAGLSQTRHPESLHDSRFTFRVSRFRLLLPVVGVGLTAGCYVLLGIQTYTNYFHRWPQSTDFTLPFDLYAIRLAADIAQAGPETAYILPMDIRAGAEARHYTLDYLLADESADYTYIPVDERNVEALLPQVVRNHDALRVVRWTADKHHEADAKEIVTFVLQTQTQPLERTFFPVYDIELYNIKRDVKISDSQINLPKINQPKNTNFGNLLHLTATYLPTTTISGDWLPVALTLAPLAPMDVDYKASLRLISPTGERLAQKDRTLLHNFHQGTSLWPPESVNEYYLLPVPDDAPPGEYTVTLVLYHPDTLAPLVVNGQAEVVLGAVEIR